MENDWNLSERIYYLEHPYLVENQDDVMVIKIKDVKEFIRRLKEEIRLMAGKHTGIHAGYTMMLIDKLAGDKLK